MRLADYVKRLSEAGMISIDNIGFDNTKVHMMPYTFLKTFEDYETKTHMDFKKRLSKNIDGVEFYCLVRDDK